MSDAVEKAPGGVPELRRKDSEIEHGEHADDHAYNLDKNAKASDYKAEAIEAENKEQKMGVIEAVRAYPMASLWAFVMSSTIVRCLVTLPYLCGMGS